MIGNKKSLEMIDGDCEAEIARNSMPLKHERRVCNAVIQAVSMDLLRLILPRYTLDEGKTVIFDTGPVRRVFSFRYP